MQRNDDRPHEIPPLVREKLAAFDGMMHAFQASFAYVEDVHGLRRFPRVPVAATVRYLHALWVCGCKDAILSVPPPLRSDGRRALDLLLAWQGGTTADVVEFLEHKVVILPFAQLTRRVQEAQAAGDTARGDRVRRGREILANRAVNVQRALEALFALSADQLGKEVCGACARYGHTPGRIREQQTLYDTPLYHYVPHPELAHRSMLVMNGLGVRIADVLADRPGRRTRRLSPVGRPFPAYADASIAHETTFAPPPYSLAPYSYYRASAAPTLRAAVSGAQEELAGSSRA